MHAFIIFVPNSAQMLEDGRIISTTKNKLSGVRAQLFLILAQSVL